MTTESSNYLTDLHRLLNQHFSLAEIRTLCFYLNLDYESLAGEEKPSRIRELLLTMARHGRLSELMNIVQRERPNVDWPAMPDDFELPESLVSQLPDAPQDERVVFMAPPDVPHFVGRKRLLDELTSLLAPGGQTSVLGGLGGVGKTALAIRLSYKLRDHFPDGVLWANLRNAVVDNRLNEPVLKSILRSLVSVYYGTNIGESYDSGGYSNLLREVLSNKKALVVINNGHGPQDIELFLPPDTSRCSVSVTTRYQGKFDFSHKSYVIPSLDEESSLAFLREVVGPARINQELAIAEDVISIIGGLPLALNVMADYLREIPDMGLHEYYELLQTEQNRLGLFDDWDVASKGVRATFGLSFERLPAEAKKLFSSLAVIKGQDFGAEAVASLMKRPSGHVKLWLRRLKAVSLIEVNEEKRKSKIEHSSNGGVVVRYRLHPLLKLFAEEKAGELGLNLEELQRSISSFYIQYSVRKQSDYDRLLLDWESINAALAWAQDEQQWSKLFAAVDSLTALNLGVLGFLDAQGHWAKAIEYLEALLEKYVSENDIMQQATVLYKLGAFAYKRAEIGKSERYLRESQTILKDTPDTIPKTILSARTMEVMADLALARNESEEAMKLLGEGIARLEGLDTVEARYEKGHLYLTQGKVLALSGELEKGLAATKKGVALLPEEPTSAHVTGYINSGNILLLLGNPDEAERQWHRGIEVADRLQDNRRLANLWQNLGVSATNRGEIRKAIKSKKNALHLYEKMGDVRNQSRVRSNLSEDYINLHDYAEAERQLDTAHRLAKEHRINDVLFVTLLNQARLFLESGEFELASTKIQAADELVAAEKVDTHVDLIRLKADLSFRKGELEEALAEVDMTLQQRLSSLERGLTLRLKGEVLLALGQLNRAQMAMRESAKTLEGNNEFELARTELQLGILYEAKKDRETAEMLFTSALNRFKEMHLAHYVDVAQKALET